MTAIVEVNDVWKRFDSLEVLQGLSFEAFKGETLVVMGGSGSGKTVLLRHIAGLIQPDQGQIKVFGQNIEALSEEELLPFRRRMGFVFQGAALFDSLTIHENVAYPLREHMRLSEDEIQGRVVEALARVGLREDVLPLLPSELSGGMRKRVGIARALMLEPEMMLYDEPTAGLDPTNAHLVSDLISGVQIGRVSAVHLPSQPGGKVRVDLNITRKYADRIRQNSVARIDTQGLLGDKIVEITVGTPDAPVVPPDGIIAARDPVDIGQALTQGTETVKNVAALTENLGKMARSFNESKVMDDVTAATGSARRATEQIERIVTEARTGRGWAHALLYEEPVALQKLNGLITATQKVLDRVEQGEGAVGVLTSPRST